MSDAPDRDAARVAGHRAIRSFVLRQGRITPAQQRAFDEHWQRYGLDTGAGPLDFSQVFARDFSQVFARRAPLVLEIGFGNGDQLLHSALAETGRDFIGVEVHGPGVGRLMNGLAEAGVDNVRVYQHDAVDVLRSEIAPSALAEARIYFPDPWHKKRHHKRRLVQPDFLALLASRIVPGGRLHLATDWADYAEHMRHVLADSPQWRPDSRHADAGERPEWRIETHFERRGLRLGHGVWDFVHERI